MYRYQNGRLALQARKAGAAGQRQARLLGLATIGLMLASGWAVAQQTEDTPGDRGLATFDAPGAGTGAGQGTFPQGITASGGIAGWYIDDNGVLDGFVRAPDGRITTFEAPGASTIPGFDEGGTGPNGMNPAGVITGAYGDANLVGHAFVRTPYGAFTEFEAPGAGKSSHQGTAGGEINPAGEIAGWYTDASNVNHPYLRAPDGTFTEFEVPGAGTGSGQGIIPSAFCGLNPAGAYVASTVDDNNVLHGFVRAPDGAITVFDAPGAGTGAYQGTWTFGINPSGAITGWYTDASNVNHGLLRAPDGTITEFNAPGAGTVPNAGTFGGCLTPSGVIGGWYVDDSGANHGFVRAPNGTIATVDVPGAGTGAGQGTLVYGIDPAETVDGFYIDSNNVAHGFVGTLPKSLGD